MEETKRNREISISFFSCLVGVFVLIWNINYEITEHAIKFSPGTHAIILGIRKRSVISITHNKYLEIYLIIPRNQ